jgi:hypothetical protein
MTVVQLTLYGTSACHLCEQAEALLMALPLSEPVQIEAVDISEDEALLVRYGLRIPVLQRERDGVLQELDWPFSSEQVLAFIAAH